MLLISPFNAAISRTVDEDKKVCSSFVISEITSISGASRWLAKAMRNSYSKSEKTQPAHDDLSAYLTAEIDG